MLTRLGAAPQCILTDEMEAAKSSKVGEASPSDKHNEEADEFSRLLREQVSLGPHRPQLLTLLLPWLAPPPCEPWGVAPSPGRQGWGRRRGGHGSHLTHMGGAVEQMEADAVKGRRSTVLTCPAGIT